MLRTFACLFSSYSLLVATAYAEPLVAPEPGAFFGAPSGLTDNAAETRDVGGFDEVLEYDRLVDENGITACDVYFGWAGQVRETSEAQKLLCGKYQFFYEHWGTPGIPSDLTDFALRWFGGMQGHEMAKLGFYPDANPRRLVTDVEPIQAGQCVETERQCTSWWWWGSCRRHEDVCVRTAPEDSWREVYTLGEDNLPIGLTRSPGRAFGLESSALTCASCHFGAMPDGRYAVGMGNVNQNYQTLIGGLLAPMQATLSAVTVLLENPVIEGALDLIGGAIPQLQNLLELLPLLSMHPAAQFNDPATQMALGGPALEDALDDVKVGTCYYKDPARTEFILCDQGHEQKGTAAARAAAGAFRARLESQHGTVYTQDWPWGMKVVFGDTYCVPWPSRPSWYGGSNDVPWSSYAVSLFPSRTLENMAEACEGARWNVDYWLDFTGNMVNLLLSMFSGGGSLPPLTATNQDAFFTLSHGTQDFLTFPLSEDGVWTVSAIPSLFGVGDDSEYDAHPGTHTGNGELTHLFGHLGGVPGLKEFAKSFVLIGGGTDPRYVECTTPDIVGNWNARPDETCTVSDEVVAPLAAYLYSLKTPHPLEAPGPQAEAGRQVFAQNCLQCHNGPRAESPGVFAFAEPSVEGLQLLPVCAPGARSTEWSDSPQAVPTFNECIPAYMQDQRPNYLGVIGTEPWYSRIFNPDPDTGLLNETLIRIDGMVTQGVKAQRLTGVRYRNRFLHHGAVDSLEELLCMPGTRRASAAERNAESCMFHDLDSPGAEEAYRAGTPICAENWAPLRGHEFGCDLGAADQTALIEYLESL
ncbi:MAG: hypothetical protein MJE66_00725 [Proteobacteria bacterium]|nr:hypothetical protein [Pseudomonadota bacterium]